MPRSWNEIDWDEGYPGLPELLESRKQIIWSPVPVMTPALEPYLEQVAATHVNGGYLLGRWRAVDYPDTTAWFLSRNCLEEYDFLRVFFGDAVVRDGLPDLEIPPRPDTSGFEQQWAGSLCLDGLLAGVIVDGGAYKRFTRPAREAKAIAEVTVLCITDTD